jgi:hypothetical protein
MDNDFILGLVGSLGGGLIMALAALVIMACWGGDDYGK